MEELAKMFEKSVIDDNGEINIERKYLQNGIYIKILEPWFKLFPLEQLLILDGEKLIIDPYSVLIKVEKYLDLEPFIQKEFFKFNEEKGFVCINYVAIKKPRQDEGKGRTHPKIDEKVIEKLKSFSVLLPTI